MLERRIQISLNGLATEEAAQAAAKRVSEIVDEVVQELSLTLAGLDGITIAYDYDGALSGLDRGFEASQPLSRTNDEAAGGVAMTPYVLRDGRPMSHIVLSAAILPFIDTPANGISGKYIIAHELAHAHEHYFRNKMLPNTILQTAISAADDAMLFDVADMCWGEYAACFLTASINPEQAKLFEEPFIAILSKAKGEINQAKKQWKADQDYSTALRKIANLAADLLKYASYLLGHATGLNKPIEELTPEAWRLLQSEEWFLPWIVKLDDGLVSMMNSSNDWKSLDVFEPLKQVMRSLLVDCGITMKFDGSNLRVWVREGKLPVY